MKRTTKATLDAEIQHQSRVLRAMGAEARPSLPRPTAGLVFVGWQWPGARVPATFREELAGAKLVRKTMGRKASGFDVLNRRARNAAERATGEWLPTFQFSYFAKDDADLEDLKRRAQQLEGVSVTVYPPKRLRSAA